MKSDARNRLRSVVGKARNLIEEDIRSQLLRLGITEGELIPLDQLKHLDALMKEKRQRIEKAIKKEELGNLSQKESFERYVRHVGFSFINRVAAFRALEVRNLLSRETIKRHKKYAGYSAREYEISERERINDPAEIVEIAFREACEDISEEISVLFDLSDEYSILFPTVHVLNQIYEHFGKDITDEDWLNDDVIGWIYQYYNSEARKEFKKKKRKPKPDDIPIINQFYTPDWIVKALVDNTLGRLWLESRGEMYRIGEGVKNSGKGRIKEYCDYIVPEKDEHIQNEIEPYEIKVLDPACGSGHFLVYAFDVLFRMYQEFDSSLPDERICELIIENNLYGIDIDLRAVQLAALSLYLKAKTLSSKTRIRKMNLVCADSRIIDGEAKRNFLRKFETKPQRHLQRSFAKLFDDLTYTYHIGSLFRIREQFEDIMDQAALPSFLGDSKSNAQDDNSQTEQSTFDEMLAFLKRFEKEAMETHDMGTLLFAAEIEKSTGLLSLLTQRYDVVVMNPPYGDAPAEAKSYLKKNYPRTHYDYYAAFMEQAISLCKKDGFVGMLTGRTYMFLKWFERVRTQLL
ncbi:MAG: Eco57I restriction-modification methylase domain-containing protein, partial [Candidatus Thorarchaeota archaeon]